MNVTNMPLNSRTVKPIAHRVMRDLGMQFRTKFTPVDSDYTVSVGDKKRITYRLHNKEYTEIEERLVNGKWKKSVVYRLIGEPQQLEDAFIQSVSQLVDLQNRFQRYRNIK